MAEEKKEKKICRECGKEIKEGEAYTKEDRTYRHKEEPQDKKEKSVICEFC